MKNFTPKITIVGGGLAGCEAAWQAATRGVHVDLLEMRPKTLTGAHQTSDLAELVCSNSFGSKIPTKASGLLQAELGKLNSLLLHCAESSSLPAGTALAVDRGLFSKLVTEAINHHPNITVIHEECGQIPSNTTIIASGPLTSQLLSERIEEMTGIEHLFFFDAIAPTLLCETINLKKAFRASRYGKSEKMEGDYINCPLSKKEYEDFIVELTHAGRIPLHGFELAIETGVRAGKSHFFEGCLPVEILARRDLMALAYGPMRPVGITDPHTGRRPHAVLQLRQDNLAGDLYSMVGFQTNLLQEEQKRVFRMIPGLEDAEIIRYGQMHRNTYIASPELLLPTMQYKQRRDLFFAGQITGVEGYLGNIAIGMVAGINAARMLKQEEQVVFPISTMIGALCNYLTHAEMKNFQPMKANFGILAPLEKNYRSKQEKNAQFLTRSSNDLSEFCRLKKI
jgi:methylenetetrahydrofolate--tRNA-(uracil-5-)-methyltransferase